MVTNAAPSLDVGHAGCRDVLKMAAEHLGWEVRLHSGGTVVWADTESDAVDRLVKLRRNDWLSWIPGVQDACGKIALAEALQARGSLFWPRSWRVPAIDPQAIAQEVFGHGRHATLIIKPDQGSQGCGISLAQSCVELQRAAQKLPVEGAIVQEYIDQPLLIDGFKWDARIYVLMVPHPQGNYAIFLEQEGLVRMCSEVYEPPTSQNLQKAMVHLTNYSLNKFSEKYDHAGDPADATVGSKRCLSAVLQRLEIDCAGFSSRSAWQALGALAHETADAICEQLSKANSHAHDEQLSRCFHLVGLDVLFDVSGRPWLLEANYRPSMMIDEVHPIAGLNSRAEVNRLFAAQRRGIGPKWGRPCRCSLHPSVHEHQLCSVDVAAKLPAIEGAMIIAQRARAGHDTEMWAEGTAFQVV
jgi:tubulin polyglutamylase TTLL6/13